LQAGVILSDYATLMVEILKDNAPPEAAATVPSTCPGRNSSGRLTVSKWWSWEQSFRRDKPGYDLTHLRPPSTCRRSQYQRRSWRSLKAFSVNCAKLG
jgi:hypothetical protein